MYGNEISIRLAQLRAKKGVSARDMSLSIGQNEGYISNIECGKALPSMSAFLFICDYLEISPRDFFDFEQENPAELRNLMNDLNQLTDEQLATITTLVRGLIKNN